MPTPARLTYPAVRRDESVVETLHGVAVADPYRWLEDQTSEETAAFVTEQNKLFDAFMQDSTLRAKFRARLEEMYNYEKFGCPFKRGGRYFYFYNTGLQSQSVLYKQSSLTAEPEVLLDPNTMSSDGTVALSTLSLTEDGELLAYGTSASGSDWTTARVRDVATGVDHADVVDWVKFSSLEWTHDKRGFFYARYPPVKTESKGTETDANRFHTLYYHRLGTPQSEDVIVYETPDEPFYMFGVSVSDDGEYAVLTISQNTDRKNKLYIAPLVNRGVPADGKLQFAKVVDNFDAEYSYVTNNGTRFFFKTNLDAPCGKIIAADLADLSAPPTWTDLVPESKAPLEDAHVVADNHLVLHYLRDVKSVVAVHNLDTGAFLRELDLPISAVTSITGRREDAESFIQITSFDTPSRILRYNYAEDRLSVFRETRVTGFDSALLEVKQVFYSSKDGTRVPMFIVHRRGLELNGQLPVFLYGYGGFNISLQPVFSAARTTFMLHMDGVLAVPNIRGGGEYGEAWHEAGTKSRKQNVFDDFQAAAEYLIAEGYTSPPNICINGGSNGGLLVGACITQRPDLFGTAIADVGVLDMLRFHKFTIGHAWTSDYGCADNAEDFEYLLRYSPLHNVRPSLLDKGFPAVLLLTGDHDDRVVPLHSYKMIATLQHVLGEKQDPRRPLLIRVDTKSGHGAGKPTAKLLDEAADRFAFMATVQGIQWRD